MTPPYAVGNVGGALREIRDMGWTVAVHNDYNQGGMKYTFWLFTHPDGTYVKGEGHRDEDALAQVYTEIMRLKEEVAQGLPKVDALRQIDLLQDENGELEALLKYLLKGCKNHGSWDGTEPRIIDQPEFRELIRKLGLICDECKGTGEIGLADGDLVCPKCYGSGNPSEPGVFKPQPKP